MIIIYICEIRLLKVNGIKIWKIFRQRNTFLSLVKSLSEEVKNMPVVTKSLAQV